MIHKRVKPCKVQYTYVLVIKYVMISTKIIESVSEKTRKELERKSSLVAIVCG